MGIRKEQLEPAPTLLMGFPSDKVIPEGSIVLPITVRDPLKQTTIVVRFLIVSYPSIYNAIMGKPSLIAIKAVVLTYYLVMKFSTREGADVVYDDQYESRICYAITVKGKHKETMHITEGAESNKRSKPKLEKGS